MGVVQPHRAGELLGGDQDDPPAMILGGRIGIGPGARDRVDKRDTIDVDMSASPVRTDIAVDNPDDLYTIVLAEGLQPILAAAAASEESP